MRKYILLFLLCLTLNSYAQYDDFVDWNWARVEGFIENPFSNANEKNKLLPYSVEGHFRLNKNGEKFHQMILRPMLGYQLENNTTVWMGYAWIGSDYHEFDFVNEHRLFQLVTKSGKIGDTPILYLVGPRLEQRMLEDNDEMNLRFRQLIKLSLPVAKFEKSQLNFFVQDEYFYRLNETPWAGEQGYDQNRFFTGIDFIQNKRNNVTISAGYMINHNTTGLTHGVQLGLRINLKPKNKKMQP
jgi:hypothetical protein